MVMKLQIPILNKSEIRLEEEEVHECNTRQLWSYIGFI